MESYEEDPYITEIDQIKYMIHMPMMQHQPRPILIRESTRAVFVNNTLEKTSRIIDNPTMTVVAKRILLLEHFTRDMSYGYDKSWDTTIIITQFLIVDNVELLNDITFLQNIIGIINYAFVSLIMIQVDEQPYNKHAQMYRIYINTLIQCMKCILGMNGLELLHLPVCTYVINTICTTQPIAEYACGDYHTFVRKQFIICMNKFGMYLLNSEIPIPTLLDILDVILHIDTMYEITIGFIKNVENERIASVYQKYKVFFVNNQSSLLRRQSDRPHPLEQHRIKKLINDDNIRFLINHKSI